MALVTDTDPQLVEPSPAVAWADMYAYMRSTWRQGEHTTVIAPTGWGKTTMMIQLLRLRTYIAAFAVKGKDSSMDEMIRDLGLWRMKSWTPDVYHRICLWPPVLGAGKEHRKQQREEFQHAIDSIYRAGGWCAFFDEVVYLAETLGLEGELKFLLNQGRSSSITVVACTQRPRFIPLAFYDQATHLWIGKDTDRQNVVRLAELAGNAEKQVRTEIPTLERYEFLYLNRDTGYRCRTKVEV